MLAVGLRGRRIDDHPVCRKCRFDLSGAPEPREKCPECGADVSGARGVRIGQRTRRPRLAGFGAFALALGLLGGAVVSWGLAKGTNWNTYKPAALLLFEARAGTAEEAEAAISEMVTRIRSVRPPSSERMRQFVDVTLAHQADQSRPWGPGWADALDVVMDHGLITERQIEEVLDRAYSFEMDMRPTARVNERVMIRLKVAARAGSVRTPRSIWIESTGATVNGVESDASLGRSYTGGRSSMLGGVVMPAPGPAEVVVRWRYAFADSPMDQPEEGEWRAFQRSTTTRVVDSSQSDGVGLRADASARESIRNSIKVARLEAHPRGDSVSLQVSVTAMQPPANLAFDLILRQNGREWRLGSLSGPAKTSFSTGLGPNVEGLQPGPVDLILRGSEAAIRRTIEMNTAWDGEIVFEGLPVEWPPLEPEQPEPE